MKKTRVKTEKQKAQSRWRRRYFYVHQGPISGGYYAKSTGAGSEGVSWIPDGPFNTSEEAQAVLDREIYGIARSYGVEPQPTVYNGRPATYLEYESGTARGPRAHGASISLSP